MNFSRKTIVLTLLFFLLLGGVSAIRTAVAVDVPSGDLIPPTAYEGYASGLEAGGGDLRQLVVMITNYVLGFLGLVAITAIIYAGILYVAYFGNDDLMAKAKNIIMYVAIGILVILLSYAIVNALILATGSDGNSGQGGFGSGSEADRPIGTIFDVEGKDFIFPVVTNLQKLGDLCPHTPIGLNANSVGCATNELIADTDGDGVANLLDTDDDGDGVADSEDRDADGDGVCDAPGGVSSGSNVDQPRCAPGPDFCPDTLSYEVFKVSQIERNKLQIDRVSKEEYLAFIVADPPAAGGDREANNYKGCAEYQQKPDIDGDGVPDAQDCDADGDGLLDTIGCVQRFQERYPRESFNPENINADVIFEGAVVNQVIPGKVDPDTDDDGIPNFGASLPDESRKILLNTLANDFDSLARSIRTKCAILPQTRRVLEFCASEQGRPKGRLIQMLETLSSDLNLIDFEAFSSVFQEFEAVAKSFSQVQAVIATQGSFNGRIPDDGGSFVVEFNALQTVDPYTQFCPVDGNNYYWFVNETLDFSNGVEGIIASPNATPAQGLYFRHEFPEAGAYNVQLLVLSACNYNSVNPGANEAASVAASIAGISSARVTVSPPRVQLVVRVNNERVRGDSIRILRGTSTPIAFDLRESALSGGAFARLDYDCDDGSGSQQLQGNQSNWQFTCQYGANDPDPSKDIRLTAFDQQGDPFSRTVRLIFTDTIAILTILPALEGDTGTPFQFRSIGSQATSTQQPNFSFRIEENTPTGFVQVGRDIQQEQTSFQFPRPGEYRVTLTVSVGGNINQQATDNLTVIIHPQDPVASFKISFPEKIKPARATLDGSGSFHPDFPSANVDDVLTFQWKVDGVVLQARTGTSTGQQFFDPVTVGKSSRIFYDFQSTGEHDVVLTVSRGGLSHVVSQKTKVDSLLGVDFAIDKPAAHVNDIITFNPDSNNALGYFWDFDDGVTLTADTDDVVHKYERQGKYKVTLTVIDGAGNTNKITKIVLIGQTDTPLAVVKTLVNSIERDQEASGCIEVTRKDSVVFDASDSVSVNGEHIGLEFFWKLEDFDELVRTRSFSRVFKELTDGACFDVELTVTDILTKKTDVAEIVSVEVINLEPELTSLRVMPATQELVTPVTVTVSAAGARDIDGTIAQYRWWYYEKGNAQKKVDVQITQEPRATFVVGPRGVEGTESTYLFAVEVEDNDGAVVVSEDVLGQNQPLTVTNGPNIAPIAEFVANRGTVRMGAAITFTSTTKDPLGEFIPSTAYSWDFEGDGEAERGISGERVTYKYTKPGVYRPTLKVTKNGLSSSYDMEVRVLPDSRPPQAAFLFVQTGSRVKFINNSTVDPALEDKHLDYAWDFDALADTDGNGKVDDDADSALPNPVKEFEGNRDMFIALRVKDSVGNSDQATRKVIFLKKNQFGALGSTVRVQLKPILQTNPARNAIDGRVYIRPPFSDVIFNAQQSTGKIQEYRLDSNIFVDGDGNGIPDDDIDNKTHPSWKDGSSFKRSYKVEEGRVRAKLTVISVDNQIKSQVIDIIFAEVDPAVGIEELEQPEDILRFLNNVPIVSFDVSSAFAGLNEPLTFDASRTSFPDEQVKEYRWDFDGDGLVDEVSFEPTFQHQYGKEGAYEVILEAVSSGGLQGEYSQTVFIRGGLVLPQANFVYELKDNEVRFTSSSSFDPSMKEDDVQHQWTFTQLDGPSAPQWMRWEQQDELTLREREVGLEPVWVRELLNLEEAGQESGLLSREVALGSDSFILRLDEGTTLVNAQSQPYVGSLALFESDEAENMTEDQLGIYETGVEELLSLSSPGHVIFNGVIRGAKLYRIIGQPADGAAPQTPSVELVAEGVPEGNMTSFEVGHFGGAYVLAGELEASDQDSAVLGVSTVKDPVKVFNEVGLYQVTLMVTDAVGETHEKREVIRIDFQSTPRPVVSGADEQLEPDEGEDDESVVIPEPRVDVEQDGGLSYVWLAIITLLLLMVGAVVFIVVKTIRQRQEELTEAPVSEPTATASAEVVKPEVVPPAQPARPVPAPIKPEKAIPVVPVAAKPVPVPTVVKEAPKPTPTKPAEEQAKKSDDKAPKPPTPPTPPVGSGGPIPDWLKG
ncbi:MAG: PKD domain-containing protein [bacterium]|nr:PKD domain-containing protein [bacterium]